MTVLDDTVDTVDTVDEVDTVPTLTVAEIKQMEYDLRRRIIEVVVNNPRTRSESWCLEGKCEVLAQCLIGATYYEINSDEDRTRHVSIRNLVIEYENWASNGMIPESVSWHWLLFGEVPDRVVEPHCGYCACLDSDGCGENECHCQTCGCNPRYISGSVTLTFNFSGVEAEEGDEEEQIEAQIISEIGQRVWNHADDSSFDWDIDYDQ